MPRPLRPSPTRALWRQFQPAAGRAYTCRCGRPVFFRNSVCLHCGTALGYAPRATVLWPIVPAGAGRWRPAGRGRPVGLRLRRCANLDSAAGCNWLLEADDPPQATLCLSCRLTRTLPDLSVPEHPLWWARTEVAKRRLVSWLVALGLPVAPKTEDPAHGLAFDLLRGTPAQPVMTGHADGLITLNIEEADDAHREATRTAFGEPYRTLLGHLRHESGHYYWQRLVEPDADALARFRALFGDERADYAQALQRHHAEGPPADWPQRHVSAYASAHPWEDWAETWAHYLHISDTLDTALSFGVDGSRAALLADPIGAHQLDDPDDAAFLAFANAWVELTGLLNELSRAMGLPDFYPFVLSVPAVRKLQQVHRVVQAQRPASVALAEPAEPAGPA